MNICLYFQVHQPYRLKKYGVFDIGIDKNYYNTNDERLDNKKIFKKVSDKCYLPANKIFLSLLKKYPDLKLSFSFSGIFLEQAQEFYPEVLKSFKALVSTGRVEILSETYYHSLAFLHSIDEFESQIKLHKEKIEKIFGVTPRIFRNTELIYSDNIGKIIEKLGYAGMLTEGADKILEWRSPNFIYRASGTKNLKLLLKNYKLSDDIAFRFSDKSWKEFPLTPEKYSEWLRSQNDKADIINLFMDYETFGEHQWKESGIFNFLKKLPKEISKNKDMFFVTPSEAIENLKPIGELSIPDYISWADMERDLSAWYSNPIQKDAMSKLFALEKGIRESLDSNLTNDWRRLTTSDHFYYMCTKYFSDGDVHKYFNPYDSPYDAFITFMNVINDIQLRLKEKNKSEAGRLIN